MRLRSPGSWELIVSAGIDPHTGGYKRVIRTIKTTSKREAKAALAKLETEVGQGLVAAEDITLAELLDRWIEHIDGLGRSPMTLYHYRQYIKRDIGPALGALKLSKLTALDIDRYYTKLRKRGLAPATIRQIHAILRASLNQAERWGLVYRNVARLASAPSQPQREQHPPDAETVTALMGAAYNVSPMFGLFVSMTAASGGRRSEVIALRWSDLDVALLTIERNYMVLPGMRADQPTKTRTKRTMTLDPETLDELKQGWKTAVELAELCGISPEARRLGYIFTDDPAGRQAWRPDRANVRWAKIRELAGVDSSVRLHDLRHFHATQLLDAKVPIPSVAKRLGHADGTTTMKVYAHGTPEGDAASADVIGSVLRGRKRQTPEEPTEDAELAS
jgi:integrase